ncbi:MAG: zinc ribbon domain-containing protein [Chloroflexota bacterium]
MLRCPYCSKQNHAGASFCIHCGEPLDADSLAKFAAEHPQPDPQAASLVGKASEKSDTGTSLGFRSFVQERRVEAVLGLLLLVGVILFVVWSYVKQEGQSAHYAQAVDAMQNGDYKLALAEFDASDGYLDSNSRLQEAGERLTELDKLYETVSVQVKQGAEAGRWWEVASAIVQRDELVKNYSVLPPLLAKARAVNGKIVYSLDGSGGGAPGIYVAEADGGTRTYIKGTDRLSILLAFAPNRQWLAYRNRGSIDSDPIQFSQEGIYLYNLTNNEAIELRLDIQPFSNVWARFDKDSDILLLGDDVTVFTFDVNLAATGLMLDPSGSESAETYERREYRSLLTTLDTDGKTTIAVGEYDGANPVTLAVESGLVDGALFSKDSRYLIYRVCDPAGTEGAVNCTLKLVDLHSADRKVRRIATIPARGKVESQNAILGEFTLDGRYLLVLERYDRTDEAHLYNLRDDKWTKLPDAIMDTGTSSDVLGPLVPDYSPGLRFWQGPNSLAHTTSASELTAGVPPPGKHPTLYETRSHSMLVSPDANYGVYFTLQLRPAGRQFYMVHLAQLAPHGNIDRTQQSALVMGSIFSRSARDGPLISMQFLPDGYTLLSTDLRNRGAAFEGGITAFRMDTGDLVGSVLSSGSIATRVRLYTGNAISNP